MSAASAQSTATISGAVVLGFGSSTTPGSATGAPVAADSGLEIVRQTGNIAFKATEDLGGGLKANFEIQTAIGSYATTNIAGQNKSTVVTTLGDRALYVNVGGAFGTASIGRTNTAIRSLFGAIGDTTTLPVLTGLSAGAGGPNALTTTSVNATDTGSRIIYGDTFSNNVSYTTPSISGFSAAIAVAPVENTATVSYADSKTYSLMYANGPLSAAVNRTTAGQGAAVTTGASVIGYKITTALASYDFGIAKVGFTTQSISLDSGVNPGNGTSVTVSAPLGNGVLAAAYGKRGDAAVTDTRFGDDVKQMFVGYRYNLSKRTHVSAVYNKIDRNVSTGVATNDIKETHIFVGHSF